MAAASARCPSCGAALNDSGRFCSECGAAIDPAAAPATHTLHHRAAQSPSKPSSDSVDHGRFLPGTLLLERYRILGLLGRGGMGEVYRADDLKLGQTVALKFLPPGLTRDAARLARFHGEVRLARQVSHPSVCRVYDLGEYEGQPFLSMEYIDGEDLATLLRRIGRLPRDKATEVARQICAGLAAAHDRGVVHRDLKPGNIMIDGRGRARVADFGLATALGVGEDLSRAGTPAYMAPEQLRGGEVGVKSDLYALGLVLYELYTGKRAFRGETLAELSGSREGAPASPSSLVEGLDPAIERAILRCLEVDPRLRPATALAVAAALPGGDPLAMALAAGETPSPEMVAAAGETGGLRPALVGACLAAIVVGILGGASLGRTRTIADLARPPKSPEVLLDRAREILKQIGYPDPPADSSFNFGWHRTYLEDLEARDTSPGRWARLSNPFPPAVYLFYRQSPFVMQPGNVEGRITQNDPAPIRPGMIALTLTPEGQLWRFDAVPPQIDPQDGPAPSIDWTPLFEVAGLRPADFKPADPHWVPAVYADTRQAWEGTTPGDPELPLRIEAAAYRGRAVSFNLLWPWTRPLRAHPLQAVASEAASQRIILSFIIVALVACGVLARQNLLAGRGDRRGAFRLAAFLFVLGLVRGLFTASHFADMVEEWSLLVRLFAAALFEGAEVWLLYIAIEPLVRRRWPDRIISWTRLLAGRFGDPLVGRDLLAGVAFGACFFLIDRALYALPRWLGRPPAMPDDWAIGALAGARAWVSLACDQVIEGVSMTLVVMVILLILRILLRRPWAAALGLCALGIVVNALGAWQRTGLIGIVPATAIAALVTWVLMRHGLLALTAMLLTDNLLNGFGLSLAWSAWYARPGIFALVLVAILVVFASRAALAGRSLFDLRFTEA